MSDQIESAQPTESTSNGTEGLLDSNITATVETDRELFLSSLSEDLRSSASVQKFTNVNDLAKSYVNLEKMMGGSLKIPGENATPEEINAFYSKLGRPASADEYGLLSTLEGKEAIADFMPLLEAEIQDFSKMAYELGLPAKTAKALVEAKVNQAQQQIEGLVAAKKVELAESKAKLNEIWGQQAEAKTELANHVAKVLAGKYPKEMQNLLNSDAARNPVVMVMLAELGHMYKEHQTVANVQAGMSATRSDALAKIDALKQNNEHPYWNSGHPDHLKARQEVTGWYKSAYGDTEV